ncbi:PREDICTED: uncharacterized oxidoreductase C663.06c-like, partial [Tauraco erythrolophus]|uniref:uncharacterized oxidoreductase C663.06c-like n=1 Tax=Tauraco erythrolophus TaxID=121530 RepID=UPI0005239D8F
ELQNLASKHPNLVIIPLDVSDPPSVKAAGARGAAARVGEQLGGSGLNLLINNAAMLIYDTLENETLERMSQTYTTNTIGPLLMGQMSSSVGSIGDIRFWDKAQYVSYRCSKAALNMLTRCQALGYREHGVLCAVLHPGWVQTDMGNSVGERPPVMVDTSVRGMLQ